ncbi:MAG: T9SS type A sorting domain-containing protein, partial [Alphaproteobacteria bacterium]|nr:T9SS type A sorting domain-containing protein [Alphaproteobacteria bacterium]
VFPNPVTNHVTITFDLQMQHSVFSIFDVTGRLITNVKTNGSDIITIDMTDLESGMYMLTDGSQTWPLIKQ